MFGKKKGLADKAGDSVAKTVGSKSPSKVDKVTAGALVLGVANWISVSVFNFDVVQAVAKKKSVPGRAAYGFLGVSALWAALRGARR
ncbi:MAG: DUF378 domain-containing protein [Actinomycetota bacterium]|nr:DUF378 domain-containing protein [Actinomycetota bacterium]